MKIIIVHLLLLTTIISEVRAQITVRNAGDNRIWSLRTRSTAYQVQITERGDVVPLYYGAAAAAEATGAQDRSRGNGPFVLHEVPVRGGMADKIPQLEIRFADGTRDLELQFVRADIDTIEGHPTLCITQKDRYYPLQVKSYIRVLHEYNIIEKWIDVRNTGRKEVIQVDNLLSASILLPANQYYLTHHGGRWFNEFQLQQAKLTAGIKTLQARDFSSFENTPWFLVSNAENAWSSTAPVWFGQVHYSGNWRIDLESTVSGHLQIAGGINFWDTGLTLAAGRSFTSPRMSFGFSDRGADDAARIYSRYIKEQVMRTSQSKYRRPVIYNSWYATGFQVNEDGQLRLAREAKDLGVELFVMDDGWFAHRNDDRAGLGDWTADTVKFPDGLQPLIEKINAMGMDFGLWVEPEMVNPNSDLYKKHPDWVLYFPHRKRNEWRHQLTLNLAREDVYQFLLRSMSELLARHNIRFLKWDRNRGVSEPGWPSAPIWMQPEVRLRYVDNLYRLIDELQKRFPEVLFESCASGGGRPDAGMLSRMDQTWTSDNTNPIDRLFIQYGYLSAWPANSMVCWTTDYDRSKIQLSQEFIFDVAMQGVLGVGDNILKWNTAQKEVAKAKIADYKSIRPLVQQGDLYRLYSPFEGNRVALQYVAKDSANSVLLCYNLQPLPESAAGHGPSYPHVRLQGLTPSAFYQLNDKDSSVYSGAYLMDVGVRWPVTGAYRSRILLLTRKKSYNKET